MSVIAPVKDGKIIESASSTQKETKTSNSSLDKDAFLQLLVAQMKYQDPLEPTSNTEYISQLATFSELEEMQNLTSGMTLQRASSLVGQYVFMKVTDSSGNTTYPEGQVDYVVYENNKAYLSINETLYSIDDLDTVADSNYLLATRLITKFVDTMNKLPKPENVTQADMEKVAEIIAVYDNMTEYQKGFLSEDNTKLYGEYVGKYQDMVVKPVRAFISDLNELSKVEELTTEQLEDVKKVMDTYENLTSYQKSLVNDDSMAIYEALEKKYKELSE